MYDTFMSTLTQEMKDALNDLLSKAPNDTPTRSGDVTADSSCYENCVELSRPQEWGPDLPFLGMPAMRTQWMAGAAAHKSG